MITPYYIYIRAREGKKRAKRGMFFPDREKCFSERERNILQGGEIKKEGRMSFLQYN